MRFLESVNPATLQRIAEYPQHADAAIGEAAAAAALAQREWAAVPLADRSEVLRRAAAELRAGAVELAQLMAAEMGKPVRQGRAEVEKCAWNCDFYAAHGPEMLADEPADTGSARAFVRYQPLGVVLAIMPWNFPLWQVFRCAAPILLAGNAMLLKHAANVSGCGLAIEGILHRAGLPQPLFRTLLLESGRVAALIERPEIAGVTLTGSEGAGRDVGARAGRCLRPVVLELGGSDPFIVLDDANVEQAARVAAQARTQNSGQSCIAAKRFIVERAVYRRFLEAFVAAMQALRMDDPAGEATDVGPQARAELRDELHGQVVRSAAAGARICLGGEVPDRRGAWYPPTVLDRVVPGMAAHDEEVFGPVAAVVEAADDEAALALANRSRFGLASSVWTGDPARAERFTDGIEAGAVFVNEMVRSDPRLPFGGIKASGCGRELAKEGIRSFTNVKSVWIA